MKNNIDEELVQVGERLRTLRKHRKLTQIDLEVMTGITNADISRIENGQKNVELATLIKLCTSLKAELFDLFNYNGELPH